MCSNREIPIATEICPSLVGRDPTERGRPVVCSHWVGGLAVPVSRRRRRRRGTAVGQAMQSRRRRAHGATRRHAAPPRSVFRRRLHVTAVGAGVYMTRNMVQIVDTTSQALPNYTVPKINIYRFNYIIITCSM